MLQFSSALLGKPVLSLRTGRPVATVLSAIINPNNLKIEGFYCQDEDKKKRQLILLPQDIREFIGDGFVVDDHDVLADPEELVRLADILKLRFELIGKPVETISKQRVGKVGDYAVEINSLFIQKIYVSQSLLKSFTGGNLSVDRTQVNEITPKRVIINDPLNKATIPAAAPVG